MASIRKRGENSYLIVVSRGYDYEGNRLKSAQKPCIRRWSSNPNKKKSGCRNRRCCSSGRYTTRRNR